MTRLASMLGSALVLFFSHAPALAVPVCAPGSLAGYLTLGPGGCELWHGLTVSDFNYSATHAGSGDASAAQVQVTPNPFGAGLRFSLDSPDAPGTFFNFTGWLLMEMAFTANGHGTFDIVARRLDQRWRALP